MAKDIKSKYLDYFTPDVVQQEFMKMLNNESDRGLVLVGSSHLDGVLKNILENYLRESRTKDDALFSFGGALGSFSNRIEIAYRVGIIDADFAYILDRIRKCRNHMAHYIEDFSLESTPHITFIKDAIEKLSGSQFFTAIIEAYRTQTSELRKAIEETNISTEELGEKTKKERQDFLTIYFALITTLKFIRHCQLKDIERAEIHIGISSYMKDTERLYQLLEKK